jgi:hypothetical protein
VLVIGIILAMTRAEFFTLFHGCDNREFLLKLPESARIWRPASLKGLHGIKKREPRWTERREGSPLEVKALAFVERPEF